MSTFDMDLLEDKAQLSMIKAANTEIKFMLGRYGKFEFALVPEGATASQVQNIEFPRQVLRCITHMLELIENKKAFSVVQRDRAMTTQEAADLLGVSRVHLVSELRSGALTGHLVGTHWRVYLSSVESYKIRVMGALGGD